MENLQAYGKSESIRPKSKKNIIQQPPNMVWRQVQGEDFDLSNYRILSLNSTNEDRY